MSLISLSSNAIAFEPNGKSTVVTLTNTKQSSVAFKFKTNTPEKYLLKPIVGKIEPGMKVSVTVQKVKSDPPAKSEQFLLQSIALTKEEEAAFTPEMWKKFDSAKVQKLLLPCQLASSPASKSESDPSYDAIQSEQVRLRERLLLLEQKTQTIGKGKGISRRQLMFFAFVSLLFGLLAPWLSKQWS